MWGAEDILRCRLSVGPMSKPHAQGGHVSTLTILATLEWSHFAFLPPICLAIAIVTAAAHREDIKDILKHGVRAWAVLMVGIMAFALGISYFFEWMLPG